VEAGFNKDVYSVLVRDDIGCGCSTAPGLMDFSSSDILEVIVRPLSFLRKLGRYDLFISSPQVHFEHPK